MRLPSEGSLSAPPTLGGTQAAQAQDQTAPPQIWRLLSPAQQEQIFQRLVLICRQLINNHDQVAPEVNDEGS
jgi:hypothetical protein